MKVMVIPDLHLPYCRKGALDFCKEMKKQYRPDKVVFLGDILDFHAVSFHPQHPEAQGPSEEMKSALQEIQKWYKVFPQSTVCLGNHDRRPARLAASVRIPEQALKVYKEMWETPGWDWVKQVTIDDVLYCHGDCVGGLHGAFNLMRTISMSVVIGHSHTNCGIKYLCTPEKRMFGMDCGCLVDAKAVQFLYQDNNPRKPIMAIGTVTHGEPALHLMPIGKGEKYHDKHRKATHG